MIRLSVVFLRPAFVSQLQVFSLVSCSVCRKKLPMQGFLGLHQDIFFLKPHFTTMPHFLLDESNEVTRNAVLFETRVHSPEFTDCAGSAVRTGCTVRSCSMHMKVHAGLKTVFFLFLHCCCTVANFRCVTECFSLRFLSVICLK